ncbi:response regulator receiver protein [Alkaliphilus metalliredigens QYMF]|uniref:Stage 0 sporulation protein A homolog n=1 Tax=Alkaliphilus metalliredigens (strain QYMF) TaxID=293826 RepID=A6TSZ7_ALKMQ|nr:DNA-binding domain-containing protein [Alkaliphilus metalliredigens]ABR49315.1 response regulator receiver protein [Alkaliphilus metalliredigens QYMF]
MDTSFYIVDDDKVIQKILKGIILNQNLGSLIGTSDNGRTAIEEIKELKPDIVLVDLLMPQIDGIGVVSALRDTGCNSLFIMISQVDSKEMISGAYKEGIAFYINKPINVVEVVFVIKSVKEKYKMTRMIQSFESAIKSMKVLGVETLEKKDEVYDERAEIRKLLAQIGILGEAGCQDIIEIVMWMREKGSLDNSIQSQFKLSHAYSYLKENYESKQGTPTNIGSIEQRIRRAIKSALKNLANLGIEDYYNDSFVNYSSALFDFAEVRREMDFERGKCNYGGKISVKKFIEGIFILLIDR